jgi:hypothetical protein
VTISLSQVVSVVLVLAVVYYIMSAIISGITKWVLDLLERKGEILEKFLKDSLESTLEEGKKFTVEELKKTPQINSLRHVRYRAFGLGILFPWKSTKLSDHVERIQPKILVDALFDIEDTAEDWKGKIYEVIKRLPDNFVNLSGASTEFKTKATLLALVDKNYYTFEQWREKLETLFGSVMDQAALQFKAVAQKWVLLFSLLFAFGLGVDSIQIAGRAWYDPQLTKKADAYAETILQSGDRQEEQQVDLQALYAALDDLAVINLPWDVSTKVKNEEGQTATKIISYAWYKRPPPETNTTYEDLVSPYTKWSLSQSDGTWFFYRILGLLITAIAVSQGSSFWYDIIRQIKGEQNKASKESTSTIVNEMGNGLQSYRGVLGVQQGVQQIQYSDLIEAISRDIRAQLRDNPREE